ncbi:MAG TPA: hypothetical protein IAD38_02340 [Candidatus Egerieenecus merdigallinarum]|nr:hypothetical protein [Candidatus Egerieenecus merdigallinarum]
MSGSVPDGQKMGKMPEGTKLPLWLFSCNLFLNKKRKPGHWAWSSVSEEWQTPLFRESKFGQPEVARICKELILQAKSTTQQGAVFP